jgi:glyoxylase-like metal-dependent hydrolase (beta-lactamase superfamily II)
MTELKLYSHEQVSERLFVVTENYSMEHRLTIGVVAGDDKVAVIDSGLGMTAGLRPYVESLVGPGKPLICLCTHGHPDHVGAAIRFDEAFLNHRDFPRLESFALVTEQRLADLEAFALHNREVIAYCRERYIENTGTKFEDVDEGDVFDLGGGVRIEVIAVPGHSDGSLAFFNRAEKYVFTGGAVNTSTLMKKLDQPGFLGARDTLDRFVSVISSELGDDAAIYPAHHPAALTLQAARDLSVACEDIGTGRTGGDPPGETIFPAKANNPDIRAHYAGNSCVVYDRSLLGG